MLAELSLLPLTLTLAGDIAAFTSKKMMQGLGLTTTELMLARAMAIRYAGKRDKPVRLIDMMARFGVDFLTITPLVSEQVQGLRQASSSHWRRMLASASDDNYSSSDESELSVSWDAADERESLPSQGTSEYSSSVTRHVENLLQCYVSVSTSTQTTTQVGSLVIKSKSVHIRSPVNRTVRYRWFS